MLALALPVVLSYLGLMFMGIVDLLCVGRIGKTAIGAVGVGTSLFTWFMIFGIGLLAGLDYLVSFAQGAKRPEDGHRAMIQSLIATTLLSLPLTGILIFLAGNLHWIGVNPEVGPEAGRYLWIVAFSLWPAILFTACRQYLTAMGVAMPALILLLLANILNAFINYLLVFGKMGAPMMGSAGSAVATVISRFALMIAMFAYLWAWDRKHHAFFSRIPVRFDRAMMQKFLQLGLPSAFQMTFEVGVFALSTALAARLTATALAAHQIVLNIASLTFMVPLGVSSATAVLVGQALGRGDAREATRTGWRGMALGVSYMACSAVVLFTFAEPLLCLFTSADDVKKLATQIILIAGFFQLSDGTQAVATGALRGLGDTRSAMLANLLGHWGIGLPIGLLLCFHLDWGLRGIWIGLSLGLTAVAAILLVCWHYQSRRKTYKLS